MTEGYYVGALATDWIPILFLYYFGAELLSSTLFVLALLIRGSLKLNAY